jgi:Flp pilus assembly protein TadG
MNMTAESSKTKPHCKQAGATAVEMALLFPLLFAVLYGTIVYGYAFFIQQEINFAAEQGARAAVAFVNPTGVITDANRCTSAATPAVLTALSAMSANELSFLGTPACTSTTFTNPAPAIPPTQTEFKVTVTFNFLGMLPAITLPGIGNIPILPPLLTATATVLE